MSLRPATVDELIGDVNRASKKIVINLQPYIARPRVANTGLVLPYYALSNMRKRIYHAWLVLTSKALAVQYSEDQYKDSELKSVTFE